MHPIQGVDSRSAILLYGVGHCDSPGRSSIDGDKHWGLSFVAQSYRFGIEDASLRGVPAFLDGTVAAAVNAAIERLRLGWTYTNTLNRTFSLPPIFDAVDGVRLAAGSGAQAIAGDTVTLSLNLRVGFQRVQR